MTAAEALDMADRIRAEATELYQLHCVDSQWREAYGAYRKIDDAATEMERFAARLALQEVKAKRAESA